MPQKKRRMTMTFPVNVITERRDKQHSSDELLITGTEGSEEAQSSAAVGNPHATDGSSGNTSWCVLALSSRNLPL